MIWCMPMKNPISELMLALDMRTFYCSNILLKPKRKIY